MMEHHVLVRLGVGQLKSASFQGPKQTSSVQKDRVESEPSLVNWWRFRIDGLLLNLGTCQTSNVSNNVAHLLDDPESERVAEELGQSRPQRC